MTDRHARNEPESKTTHRIPWDSLDRSAGSAFATGGVALGASLVVPPALGQVTEWAWVAGLVLVGVAVLAFATGLAGLYPRTEGHAPGLSAVGAGAAVVAGLGALGLIAMGGVALAAAAVGVDPGKPMAVFAGVALATALALAVGLVASGVGLWVAEDAAVTPGLLVTGGAALLVPAGGELLRLSAGVPSPGWLLFPVLVVLVLDGLGVGYALRATEGRP